MTTAIALEKKMLKPKKKLQWGDFPEVGAFIPDTVAAITALALGAPASFAAWHFLSTGNPLVTVGATTATLLAGWVATRMESREQRNGYIFDEPMQIVRHSPVVEVLPAPVSTELTDTLAKYGIVDATPGEVKTGPVVARHFVHIPRGTRLGKLPDGDIARDLGVASITINNNAGRGMISLDLPRLDRQEVAFQPLFTSEEWKTRSADMALPVCPGVDAVGNPFVFDLRDAVHLFVAGTTGAGKSVFANALILSLMISGKDFYLMIADGKGEDFAPFYRNSKHLLVAEDIVTVVKDKEIIVPAPSAIEDEVSGMVQQINWLVAEMDRRFMGGEKAMPIIFAFDEVADVMGLAGKEMEEKLQRLSQKGRSANIHMILCTQSPNSEIFGQTFRATIPSAVGLYTKTGEQSKVAIQQTGCEKLLRKGDAFVKIGADIHRVHGAKVTESHLMNLVV